MTTRPHGASRGFRHLDRRGTLLLVVLLVVPAAIALVVGRSIPALDPILESVVFHIYVVSAIAACALFVALVTATYAVRDGRATPVLLALGCVAVGFMMLGHGLTTPGIFLGRPMNMWVARLPVLALATFAGCLAAAARPDGVVSRFVARSPRVALLFPAVSIALASTAIAIQPTVLWGSAPVPAERDTIKTVLLPSRAPSRCWWSVGSLAALAAGAEPHRAGIGPGELADHVRVALARLRDVLEALVVGLPPVSARGVRGRGLGGRHRVSRLTHPGGRGRRHDGARSAGAGRSRAARRAPRADRRRRGEGPVYARTLRPRCRAAPPGSGCSWRWNRMRSVVCIKVRSSTTSGKMSVPDEVLNKPGELDADEWEQIQRHPEIGWDLVSRADSLRGALSAIRHHHERWDGTGYPESSRRHGSPASGRIVAVADVWGRADVGPGVPSGVGPRSRGLAPGGGERNPVRCRVRRGVPGCGGRHGSGAGAHPRRPRRPRGRRGRLPSGGAPAIRGGSGRRAPPRAGPQALGRLPAVR